VAAPPPPPPPANHFPPLVYPPAPPPSSAGWEEGSPPATVLAPEPEQPDFNGQTAVIARLPRLGSGPSQLDEYQKETRGTFAVRVVGATGQPEIEVGGDMRARVPCLCPFVSAVRARFVCILPAYPSLCAYAFCVQHT